MLVPTQTVLIYFEQILNDIQAPNGVFVRIEQIGDDGSATLTFGRAESDDHQFRYLGRIVLIVDEHVANCLKAKTLDVEETDKGAQLILK